MSLLSNELSIDEVKVANYKDQGQTFVIQEGSTHKESWEVLATKAFKKGDLVFVSHRLSVSPVRTCHTLQKDWNLHINISLPCRFFNHSCSPSLMIKDNAIGAYDFFALTDINVGDHFTWDYDSTEYAVEHFPASCMCGTKSCRDKIIGFKFSQEAIKSNYGDYFAEYLH